MELQASGSSSGTPVEWVDPHERYRRLRCFVENGSNDYVSLLNVVPLNDASVVRDLCNNFPRDVVVVSALRDACGACELVRRACIEGGVVDWIYQLLAAISSDHDSTCLLAVALDLVAAIFRDKYSDNTRQQVTSWSLRSSSCSVPPALFDFIWRIFIARNDEPRLLAPSLRAIASCARDTPQFQLEASQGGHLRRCALHLALPGSGVQSEALSAAVAAIANTCLGNSEAANSFQDMELITVLAGLVDRGNDFVDGVSDVFYAVLTSADLVSSRLIGQWHRLSRTATRYSERARFNFLSVASRFLPTARDPAPHVWTFARDRQREVGEVPLAVQCIVTDLEGDDLVGWYRVVTGSVGTETAQELQRWLIVRLVETWSGQYGVSSPLEQRVLAMVFFPRMFPGSDRCTARALTEPVIGHLLRSCDGPAAQNEQPSLYLERILVLLESDCFSAALRTGLVASTHVGQFGAGGAVSTSTSDYFVTVNLVGISTEHQRRHIWECYPMVRFVALPPRSSAPSNSFWRLLSKFQRALCGV